MVRRLVTTSEAAAALGVARSTLARWTKEGRLTPTETTLGGQYRWDIEDLRRQLREARQRDE